MQVIRYGSCQWDKGTGASATEWLGIDVRGDDESSPARAHRALSNPTKERITSNSDLNLEEGASYADDANNQNSASM